MTRDAALRLLALLLTALLFGSVVSDPVIGYGSLFVIWGLLTAVIGNLFVARSCGRVRYPSGGDLSSLPARRHHERPLQFTMG